MKSDNPPDESEQKGLHQIVGDSSSRSRELRLVSAVVAKRSSLADLGQTRQESSVVAAVR
jgi:hypothetical protein